MCATKLTPVASLTSLLGQKLLIKRLSHGLIIRTISHDIRSRTYLKIVLSTPSYRGYLGTVFWAAFHFQ